MLTLPAPRTARHALAVLLFALALSVPFQSAFASNASDAAAEEAYKAWFAETIQPVEGLFQKMEAACTWVGAQEYYTDWEHARWQSLFLNGSGDCWAGAALMHKVGTDLGLEVYVRNGDRDPWGYGNHRNVITRIDGHYWIFDASPGWGSAMDFDPPYLTGETDGGVIVRQYDGFESDVVVPAQIGGKPVVAIDALAFERGVCGAAINSISLPASLASIDSQAFEGLDACTRFTVDEANPVYVSSQGSIYTRDGTLVARPSAAPEVQPLDSTVFTRLYGEDALGTMARICEEGFAQSNYVVVASAQGYWDALSASALAGAMSAPVLLCDADGLPQESAAQITRLGATAAVVCGGPNTVGDSVVERIEELGLHCERVSGADAAGTAVAVAQRLGIAAGKTCVVASSDGYWDALAASPFAYAKKAPIFLTELGSGVLGAQTLAAIAEAGFEQVLIAGGEQSVSAQVEAQLAAAGIPAASIVRLAGESAVETSASIALHCLGSGMHADGLGVATTAGYWDALTGAALCGFRGAPLVLVNDANRSAIQSVVAPRARQLESAYVLGGPLSVSVDTWNVLATL